MSEEGKLFDVLVLDDCSVDPATGMQLPVNRFKVWASLGLSYHIKKVPGVHSVTSCGNCYTVLLDPRYDPEWVRAEIEAICKIHDLSIGEVGNENH